MGGLTSLNLSFNQLCGLDYRGGGTYTAEGITAIADAMRINGALTRVDVRHNNIAGDCAEQLSAAVLGNLNIEMFNEIPIKEMRANSITGLDLMEKGVGVEGGMVVAGLIPVMGALTSINLRGNELGDKGWGAIFAAICGNKDSKIMSMDVSCENISPACVKLIAEALRTSVTGGLTRVDVRHNNIAGDGAEQLAAAVLGTLKIEMFNEIPIKEMRANSITELDLNGKGVGVEGGMVVAGLIPVMGGLTSLDLSNNLLCGVTGTFGGGTYTAEGITAIAEALRVNGALTVTNLLHNQLDEASAKMLAEVAKQRGISLCGIQRDRTTADFSNKFLMPPDAILLASDLSQAAVTGGLTKISLAKNELGEEGTKAICEALEQNKTLKELDIRGNRHRHGNIGGSAGAKHVAKMLGVNGGLTSLDLSNNALCGVTFMGGTYTAEGITAIAHALRVNGALKSIDLSGNQLCGIWTEGYGDQQGTYTAEGITAIADALRVNGGLTSIDLSNNQLCGVWTDYRGQHGTYTAEGITAIADAMRVNGGLTSIDLSGNQLCGIWTDDDGDQQGTYTAEGITAIADALRVNGALTSINLRGNELGDKGWGAIFAAICGSKDSKIMSLDASCENISPAGVQLIAEALRTSVTGALTRVDVRHNNIAGDGAVQLAAAVLGNFKIEIFNEIPIKEMRANSITELDLNGKDFGVEGVMVVAGLIPVMGALTSVWTSAHDSLSSQY
ncbi:protein nlrc3 [Chrysochromulina tobinii]|uniref:Protein nlrc3 n=1 Tax=Chrysochromulina tobinii TaxID=1460289 RepID=A0A0M0JQ31_9EUKA|nr:protein nlrc3 [Chrysochromulina tobinii]|eukprot:KOO28694.1 protein nlrc3 [Chrysochromulina sp. CCMP291]